MDTLGNFVSRFAIVALGLFAFNGHAAVINGLTYTIADRPAGTGENLHVHFLDPALGDFCSSNPDACDPPIFFPLAEVGAVVNGTEEARGVSEVDISALVTSSPSAVLEFRVFADDASYIGGGPVGDSFDIDVVSYVGNNALDLSDFAAAATGSIGTFSTSGLVTGDILSFDVSGLLGAAITNFDESFGIRLESAVFDATSGAYTFDNFKLKVLPLPGTLLLLGLGIVGVFLNRRLAS